MLETIGSYFPDVIIWFFGVIGLLGMIAGFVIHATSMKKGEKKFAVMFFGINSLFFVTALMYYLVLYCIGWSKWACFGAAFVITYILLKVAVLFVTSKEPAE